MERRPASGREGLWRRAVICGPRCETGKARSKRCPTFVKKALPVAKRGGAFRCVREGRCWRLSETREDRYEYASRSSCCNRRSGSAGFRHDGDVFNAPYRHLR
jgi:hypothetical protein